VWGGGDWAYEGDIVRGTSDGVFGGLFLEGGWGLDEGGSWVKLLQGFLLSIIVNYFIFYHLK
jgi:hypothetical protein